MRFIAQEIASTLNAVVASDSLKIEFDRQQANVHCTYTGMVKQISVA